MDPAKYNDSCLPEDVLEELKKHATHIEVKLCLECGYSGMMGVLREEVQGFVSWWVLVPVLFFFGMPFGWHGLIGALCTLGVILFMRDIFTKKIVICPKCKNTLTIS